MAWMRYGVLIVLVLTACLAAQDKPVQITGKLTALPDKAVGLKLKDKTVVLGSDDEYVTAILGDERLIGKTMQVSGLWKEKDKRFQVTDLLTVHDGKLYHVTYWCDICNVGASKPGPCICCLQPVDLREVLVEEKK